MKYLDITNGIINIKARKKWRKVDKIERNGIWYNVVPTQRTKEIYVSNYGEIKRIDSNGIETITKGYPVKNGAYLSIGIAYDKDGKVKTQDVRIHRLVAYAFLHKPKWADRPNHIDNDGTNNYVGNLEWTDADGNNKHARNIGVCVHPSGETHQDAKLDNDVVLNVICPMIIKGYTNIEVRDYVKSIGYSECTSKMIAHIRGKSAWKHLTTNFTFPKSKYKRNIN